LARDTIFPLLRGELKVFRRWRRERANREVKAGDGRAIKPLRWWQGLHRSVFFHDTTDDDGNPLRYAVDISLIDPDGKVELFLDGAQVAVAIDPASFPVPGGAIEVRTSARGLARMHFVPDDGEERVLRPHPRSAGGLREKLGKRYPRTSSVIGGLAIAVLILGLVLVVPQILEWASDFPVVADNLGTFTSPIALPAWVNTTLVVAGILAAIERTLTMRNHWLLDADTWYLGL